LLVLGASGAMSYLKLAKQIAAQRAPNPAEPGGARPTTLRPGDAGFATTVASLIGTPLDVFETQGASLDVRVPWWPETLWFVPTTNVAERLGAGGIARHRIWTAGELLQLLSGIPLASETLTALMVTRREFGGEVVGILPIGEKRVP